MDGAGLVRPQECGIYNMYLIVLGLFLTKLTSLWVKKMLLSDFVLKCFSPPGSTAYPDFTQPEMRSLWASKFAYDYYEVRLSH